MIWWFLEMQEKCYNDNGTHTFPVLLAFDKLQIYCHMGAHVCLSSCCQRNKKCESHFLFNGKQSSEIPKL